MLKLSIIGCGNVAKTMAYLWHQSAAAEIVNVVNRSQASANQSVKFIGAGKPLSDLRDLEPADIFIIGCGDDYIEACLSELMKQSVVNEDTLVFHFSGAKNATVLNEAKTAGAKCASLHPVKSFANPSDAIHTFENTYCGLEGDTSACGTLKELIKTIGGHCFNIDSDKKLTYHAASVFACNYLTALQELSIKTFEHSGIDRDLAMKILTPIVTETTNNIFTSGTAKSLTGPIARGDSKLVAEQLHSIAQWNSDAADIYRLLGKIALDLSVEKGISAKGDLDSIRNLFS